MSKQCNLCLRIITPTGKMGHSVFNKISGQQRFSVEIGELYDKVRLMDWLCFD